MTNCPVCDAPVGLTWTKCGQCGHPVDGIDTQSPAPAPAPTVVATQVADAEVVALPAGTSVCTNHASRAATSTCSVCAEPFCAECLDQPGMGATCKSCLAADPSALAGREPIATKATDLARQALTLSIVGIFCFGIVLEPLALIRGLRARRQILASPVPVQGAGKAMAAIVIASIILGFWALGILLQVLAQLVQ